MTDWTVIAGGRCAQSWHVGIAGFDPHEQQAFVLSHAQWNDLARRFPIGPLVTYGAANGLNFERYMTTAPTAVDGLLLIACPRDDQPLIPSDAATRRYLVLHEKAERAALQEAQGFALVLHPYTSDQFTTQEAYLCAELVGSENDGWAILQTAGERDASRLYHRSADFWILRLTGAIADDARIQQQRDVMLSVLIPSYNYGRYLTQCVRSVLAQGLQDIEVLVLDNASTDETSSVMQAFATEPRVRYLRNRYNYGPGYNWRNGLWIAGGRYFTFLSADDYFNEGHLSRLIPALERHSQVAVGYTSIRWVDDRGQALDQPRHPGYRDGDYIGGRNEVADLLIHDNYMTPSAVIYRRKEFCTTWRPGKTFGAGDWEMVVQMAERYPDFAYINVPGVSYRWHGAQESTSFYASTDPLEAHLAIVEGVLARGAQHWLKNRELDVALHLRRRLALYPTVQVAELTQRTNALVKKLLALAEDSQAPLFTVVVTTYDRPVLLEDALISLEAQTLRDFEVILVNDKGGPVEHLLDRCSVPIIYLRQGRNQGPAAARNAAHRLARGRYIAYLDDDDLFMPGHLQTLANAIAAHPGTVIYSDAVFVAERIESGMRESLGEERRYAHDHYSYERLLVDNYIPVNTFAWPRALLPTVGDFDETLSGLEDWDFLLRLASKAPFYHLAQETVQVRMRIEGGATDRRSQTAFKDYAMLYQEIYSRHPVPAGKAIEQARTTVLARFGGVLPESRVHDWIALRQLTPVQSGLIEHYLDAHDDGPCITIFVLMETQDESGLAATLDSLDQQHYRNIVVEVIKAAVGDSSNTSLIALLNAAIQDVRSDWFLLLRPGEVVTQNGLVICALELIGAPGCRAIYADQLQRAQQGEMEIVLRPDLNLDLLLSFPRALSRHWLIRRDVCLAAGGFDPDYHNAAEFDLLLRLIEADGLSGIGHVAEPLIISEPLRVPHLAEERATLLRHLQQRGYSKAEIVDVAPGCYHIEYGHVGRPLVSLLIIVHDQLAKVQRCVISLLEHTEYSAYEVLLVDNASETVSMQEWLQGIDAMASQQVRVLRSDKVLDRATLLNLAAAQAKGEYLLLLSPECAIFRPEWLGQMLNQAQRPEVGIVGAKLVSSDEKIVHAGQILGLGGTVGHAFIGEPMAAPGYMNRLLVTQNYSAVSADCMMIRRSLYDQLGGLDEAVFAERGSETDLCLRLGEAGYLTVWTPHAVLLSNRLPEPEPVAFQDAFYDRWLPRLARDPAYNPNLSLSRSPGGFELTDSSLTWNPLTWRPLPVVMAHYADTFGCGHYRVIQPFHAQRAAGLIQGIITDNLLPVVDLERYSPDVIVLQRQIGDERLEAMRRMKLLSHAFTVYELDDYLPNLPLKSIHREQMPKDIVKSLRRGLGYVDRFVVSTEVLADAFADFHSNIMVVENRLDPHWWHDLPLSRRRRGSRPRVGWAGGSGHTGDLELIVDVVKSLAQEVEWVFMGMCPASIRPYVKEIHAGVPINLYPHQLAALDLDLALAPLEQNLFNQGKSNLRLLEYGICGFPVVCSDIQAYAGNLPVTRVKNRYLNWVEAIRMHLADLDATARMGDELRRQVAQDWMLEGVNLEAWYRAWQPN